MIFLACAWYDILFQALNNGGRGWGQNKLRGAVDFFFDKGGGVHIILQFVCVCVSVCSPLARTKHVTGRLFYQREVVTPYLRFPSGITYSVFINAAKVDAGCARVVNFCKYGDT